MALTPDIVYLLLTKSQLRPHIWLLRCSTVGSLMPLGTESIINMDIFDNT